MKRLQLGRYVFHFDARRLDSVAKEVAKTVRGKVEYYDSRMPLSMFLSGPSRPRRTKTFNHIIVTTKGKKIVEFFGTNRRAGGRIYENNLSKDDFKKIESQLLKRHIFTFESFKRSSPKVRFGMVGMSLLLIFLSAMLLQAAMSVNSIENEALATASLVIGATMLAAYIR